MTTKTRLLLAALLLFASALMLRAQTAPRLVVWLKSGEKVYYDLASQPEASFTRDELVIRCDGRATAFYYLYTVSRFTYEGAHTGVDLLPNERSVELSREGDAVIFRNLPAGSTARVYAANGVLQEQRQAQAGQPLTLSVGQRPSGVYIVKAGNETIKLLRK